MQIIYSEFAHSVQMQIILAVITFAETFLTMYMISNVIMAVFKVTLSKKQKFLFTFINGSLLQTAFVYGVYLLGGMISFSPFIYILLVNVNPIAAMIYYYSALKIFKLSNERSVKLMSYMLIFWATKVSIGKLIHVVFTAETRFGYNYLIDALQQTLTLLMFFLVYKIVLLTLKTTQVSLKFSDNMFFNKRKELLIYFFAAFFIFAVNVIIPSVVSEQIIANIIIMLILLLYTIISICTDIIGYNKQIISNRDIHINVLFRGMEELRGVKQDFNNILQTYSGYLELKEYEKLENYHSSLISATSHSGSIMDLTRRMHENPSIISLLISKIEYAEKMNVKLLVSLKCSLDNLFINDMDIAIILACLLENAIESASCSEQRKAYFTVEEKSINSKLIIATGSSPSTEKNPNKNKHLINVRNILSKYGNCTYQIEYRNQEISAYVELKGEK